MKGLVRGGRLMKRPMSASLVTIVLGLLATPCNAIICDGGIVSEGNTQVDVLRRCGPPTFVTQPDKTCTDWDDSVSQTTVIHWIYNLGPGKFIRTITFTGDRVTDIEEGDYGYLKNEKGFQ
jgi:hypothetical protein